MPSLSRSSLLFAVGLAGCAGPRHSADAPTTVPTAPAEAPSATVDQAPAPAPLPQTDLYVQSYGTGDATLVFLHGGPGYNAAMFEASTAEALGEHHRVLAYDRRGSGRSAAAEIKDYTFDNAAADLDAIVAGVASPILVGHSFGGILALEYLARRPDFEGAVILVNAPIQFGRTLETIIANCRTVYEAKKDADSLEYLVKLEAMDHGDLQYANYSFMHGMGCGLYRPAKATEQSQEIMSKAATHPAAEYFTNNQPMPVIGFYAHERHTTLDETGHLRSHADQVWAIYGAEDRIISPDDRALLGEVLGPRYLEIPGAAHNTFVDQQDAFVKAVDQIVAEVAAARK